MKKMAMMATAAAILCSSAPAGADDFYFGAGNGSWDGGPGFSIGFGTGWGPYAGWDSYGYSPGYYYSGYSPRTYDSYAFYPSSYEDWGYGSGARVVVSDNVPRHRTRRAVRVKSYPRYAYDPGYYDTWNWGSSANVGLSFAAQPDYYDGKRYRRARRDSAYVSFGYGDRYWDNWGWNARHNWAW